jgi:small subunit ribosomal protein S20
MANHISALKRVRQTRRRTARNRRNKGVLRSGLREIREVLESGNLEQARKQMPGTFSCLDKAVHKGVLHRNTVARLKSRLMGRLNGLGQPKAA